MRSVFALVRVRSWASGSCALAGLLAACGGSDGGSLFSGGSPGVGQGGIPGAAGRDAGGTSGMPPGGAAGVRGPGAGGLALPPGAGGESGAANVDAGPAGGGGGGAPVSLPTGTQGFPTNAADCPATLPGSKVSCNFGLSCQYPGMLCTCGVGGTFGCIAQQSQCLAQPHCSSGYCHPDLHVCTTCVVASHCAAPTPQCRWDGFCVQCVGDADCSSPTPICNVIPLTPTLSTCVECRRDSDCAKSQTCQTLRGTCK